MQTFCSLILFGGLSSLPSFFPHVIGSSSGGPTRVDLVFTLAQIEPASIRLWTGIAFAVLCFALLVVIFFLRPVLTEDQRNLIRLFCALLAGCAGAFLAGDGLFDLSHETTGTKMTVRGTAGFALFFCVWFTFNPLRRKTGASGFSISFVEGLTFERATEILGEELKAAINIDALTNAERLAQMQGLKIEAKDPRDVLAKLRSFVKPPDRVRSFRIEGEQPVFTIIPVTP